MLTRRSLLRRAVAAVAGASLAAVSRWMPIPSDERFAERCAAAADEIFEDIKRGLREIHGDRWVYE